MKQISYTEIDNACFKIAEKIKSENCPNYTIVAVSRGGLVPAAIVSHYLGYKDIKFIRLSSYSNEKQHSEIVDTTTDIIENSPSTYIIDDICDSGDTLQYLKRKYPNTRIFTLINKNPTILPDYYPISEPSGLWIHFPWEVEDK